MHGFVLSACFQLYAHAEMSRGIKSIYKCHFMFPFFEFVILDQSSLISRYLLNVILPYKFDFSRAVVLLLLLLTTYSGIIV